GEFQDIGAVINEFASDDATVVMGTAIDESLEGEIRVTVVATGLGNTGKMKAQASAPAPTPQPAEIKVVKKAAVEAELSYKDYDKPVHIRKAKSTEEAVSSNGQYDEEMLDIPAFLRRQAD
ncbi:MAG: cell division protein FtsZ, partial [Gammaproteobacteria bacterium]|nr:cell division protein FtsZ [Gammaproteobacteria bacterium]